MQLEAFILPAIMFVISLIVNGLLLGVVLGWTKGENREFGDTIVTALIISIINAIPIVNIFGCVIAWYIIKTRHEQTWGGAITTWLVLIIVYIILLVVIAMVFLGGLLMLLPIPLP